MISSVRVVADILVPAMHSAVPMIATVAMIVVRNVDLPVGICYV